MGSLSVGRSLDGAVDAVVPAMFNAKEAAGTGAEYASVGHQKVSVAIGTVIVSVAMGFLLPFSTPVIWLISGIINWGYYRRGGLRKMIFK